MEHSQAEIILQVLTDLELVEELTSGSPTQWSGYVGSEPDGPDIPDDVITIYDTAGRVFNRSTPDSFRIDYPGVQIRIRSGLYQPGYNKAKSIALALDIINHNTVNLDDETYLIYTVNRSTEVLSLGKESPTSKRNLFTVNATVSYRKL